MHRNSRRNSRCLALIPAGACVGVLLVGSSVELVEVLVWVGDFVGIILAGPSVELMEGAVGCGIWL